MAGLKNGFFIGGANAKLIVNQVTLAYATDVSYRIQVKHAAPKVLGMHEAQEISTLAYDVTGTFTIIRYTAGHKLPADGGYKNPKDITGDGNGIGAWTGSVGNSALNSLAQTLGTPFGPGAAEGRAHHSFIPSALKKGMMFDIEIRHLIKEGANNSTEECAVARFRNCRITDSQFTLNKRGVATQQFSFMARYADEDTFYATKSGIGQDLE